MGFLQRRQFIKLSGAAGITALSGCQDVVGKEVGNSRKENTDDLGLAISNSGSGCLSQWDDELSGWVHTVAHGESYDITFDLRISHNRGDEINADLTKAEKSDGYLLQFTIDNSTGTPDKRTQSINDSDCNLGTRIKGGGSIPLDFNILYINVNGDNIKTIDRKGSFAAIHTLPDPV